MAKSLRELNNCCNILKKGFIALRIMQLIELITIIHSLNLFNLLKAIGTAFYVSLYGLNIEC